MENALRGQQEIGHSIPMQPEKTLYFAAIGNGELDN